MTSRKGFVDEELQELERKYGSSGGGKSNKSKSSSKSSPSASSEKSAEMPGQKDSHKKQKYVNLYSDEGREKIVEKLPGRHKCECQTTKHVLINNCINCGRIVCSQEGSGPCYFCENLVCSKQEQEFLNKGGKKAEEMRRKLMLQTFVDASKKSTNIGDEKEKDESGTNFNLVALAEGFKRAVAEKDRLLEYQQNSAKRTTVFDDQADYFNAENVWLSPEEKKILMKRQEDLLSKKKTAKSALKITLDFAGRKIVEDNQRDDEDFANYTPILPSTSLLSSIANRNTAYSTYAANPEYVMELSRALPSVGVNVTPKRASSRIQDLALDGLQDSGSCLSMHQPYASLLVRGIKKHEGRNWYSNHRGILWIASAAKPVTNEEIKELENFYRLYYGENLPENFPDQYPVSCLLGCVEVVDCLAQEQYRQMYPQGESESPYVMICENPRELPMKFPISGKHKIYKLDPQIHQAAKKGIEYAAGTTKNRSNFV